MPGWGSLRVVWPLLAAMTWLCKSRTMAQSAGSQQISQADKQPDYQTEVQSGDHALQADSCMFLAASILQPVAGLQLDRVSDYQAEWIPSLRLLGHEFDQTGTGRLHHAHVAALKTLRLRRAGESL